jgi:hypothetical protein
MMFIMKNHRIHIVGASGAGTTTVGRATADILAFPTAKGGPNHWECCLRDPDGYVVVLASPDGSAG